MKDVFKPNALIAISYTVFLVCISFLVDKSVAVIILTFIYSLIAGFHFMAMGVLMGIYHFKDEPGKRNGYMASFALIFALMVLVGYFGLYIYTK